jgi:hypothetical protein
MGQYGALILAFAIGVALTVYRWRTRQRLKSIENERAKWTLEQKLDLLRDCGFVLAEPFSVDDLLESWGREAYEKPGFDMVLVGLGSTEEQEPWRNYCVNLWHFDTECIEGDGSYVRIAERMAEMAQGSLPLAEVCDKVDIDERSAPCRWRKYATRSISTSAARGSRLSSTARRTGMISLSMMIGWTRNSLES